MKAIQPRPFNPRKTLFVGLVLLTLIFVALRRDPPAPPHMHWTGHTMGTLFDFKIAHAALSRVEAETLYRSVMHDLSQVNRQMSTYQADSEISRFNTSDSVEPFAVSPSLATVTQAALEWTQRTGGAFDPTLSPLINLWGFGQDTPSPEPPSADDVQAALALKGAEAIRVIDGGYLQKERPHIQLNLNAIAKGYAVDRIATRFRQAGLSNFYVEIGGDMIVSGRNREGQPWRIGIETPDPDAPRGTALHAVAHLTHGALAGSGNYRRFRHTGEGITFSHILDPRTGYPVGHALVAVNVWAAHCMDADAAATALIVMGAEEGRQWIETLPEIEAIFFIAQPDGHFDVQYSSGFIAQTGIDP